MTLSGRFRDERATRFPPGPRGLAWLDQKLALWRDPLTGLERAYGRYGGVLALRGPLRDTIALFEPEAVMTLLRAAEPPLGKTTLGGLASLASSRGVAGAGILNTSGRDHEAHRDVVLRSFARQHLVHYQALAREIAADELARWQPGTIELTSRVTTLGKRVAHRILFGVERAEASRAFGEALDALAALLDELPVKLAIASLVPFDVPGVDARRRRGVVDRFLHETFAQLDTRSMAHALLGHGAELGWGRAEVRDNLVQLYVTGYDTTTCALTWALYLLAQHPEVASRLLAECAEVLRGADPTFDALGRMPYLDAVIKEALRLYPTGPYAYRSAQAPLDIAGYRFGRGTVFLYSPWVTHRIPQLFAEPRAFQPQRFAAGTSYPRGAYLPFGHGNRSCVAAVLATLELKTLVAMIAQRFRIDIVPGQRLRAMSIHAVHLKPGLQVRLVAQDGETSRSPAVVFGNVVGARPDAPGRHAA
jgi:cytochrome P450